MGTKATRVIAKKPLTADERKALSLIVSEYKAQNNQVGGFNKNHGSMKQTGSKFKR